MNGGERGRTMNENQYGVLLDNILDKVNAIAEGQRNIERNLKQ